MESEDSGIMVPPDQGNQGQQDNSLEMISIPSSRTNGGMDTEDRVMSS